MKIQSDETLSEQAILYCNRLTYILKPFNHSKLNHPGVSFKMSFVGKHYLRKQTRYRRRVQ